MSELDLGLKVASRRLMWRMGFSTRVDVPLRTTVPRQGSGRERHETFTDLDVLGFTMVSGFAVRAIIADCKTSQRGSTERMFWIRGVADFFAADDAWMVRSSAVTGASRQLSARLGISVLEPADLAALEGYHPSDLTLNSGPLGILFDQETVSAHMKGLTSQDKKLDALVEYRQFDYWAYEEFRNLMQVPAHLTGVGQILDPSQPAHRALFYDCAWLYTLSLARAASHVRAVHATDVDTSLQAYLFGGHDGLLEKQRLAKVLSRLAPAGATSRADAADGVLPPWYPQLLELLTRHLRRPHSVNAQLRFLEWLSEAQQAKVTTTVDQAFGNNCDDLAAKLAADTCGFLITACGLDRQFRVLARAALNQPQGQSTNTHEMPRADALDPVGAIPQGEGVSMSDEGEPESKAAPGDPQLPLPPG